MTGSFGKSNRAVAGELGELSEKTVAINRVSKVVKGGRRFSFNALVVCGDGRGHVGFGLGKAAEVPDAIRKATDQAKKTMYRVPLRGSTIPHEVVGIFGPTKVLMKPARPGTGVIAGSAVRAIVDATGIRDIRTKCIGSNNAHNVLYATLDGMAKLLDPAVVAMARGRSLDDVEYAPF